jgi:hypothetical protein
LIYILVEQQHVKQKHIAVVAYYSSCRKYRGRYNHMGSYSSSHDWLHMYDPMWRDDRDDWKPCYQHCIRVISLVQRGRDHSYSGAVDREIIPWDSASRRSILKDSSVRGSSPKEIYHFPLMSKGERYLY